ncbi:AMP-binding enzyme [delta proteobacterium NaphS2]|nr:AMP-binding enzyme [delta proteobacterium NaphS2]
MKWSIGKISSKRALWSPDKTAIIYEDASITYKQLNDDVNRISHLFQEMGLKKGDRIAVDLLNCPEFLVSFFAAAKLGLIFLPLNFRMVSRELTYQLNRCNCRLLLFHDVVAKHIESIRDSVQVEADKFICVKSNLPEGPDCPAWAVSYPKSIEGRPKDEPTPDAPIDLDDPLAVLFTSGVSGDPKGAVISHGQFYFKSFQIINYTDMRQGDVFLFQSPLCHSAGLCGVAIPCLCRGATLLVRMNFDPEQFVLDIEQYKATILFALTTMFRIILNTGALDHVDVSGVRVTIGGGEKTSPAIIQELEKRGLFLQMGYGQTENSAMILMPKNAMRKKEGSCGLPNFFTDAWIEDRNGVKLRPGEIGEIVAIGPNVMSGYWDMPEETAETIVDGKLHTGDLGYMDEDGFFYLVDRAKDMYRSGGENVYPVEIEKVLVDHPKIENVAIIGIPDEKWGETGKAFIVCRKGKTITQEEVFGFLEGEIARFKFPAQIELMDSLPTTAWGKIKKSALRQYHRDGAMPGQ